MEDLALVCELRLEMKGENLYAGADRQSSASSAAT
jgi:hypothetical protein